MKAALPSWIERERELLVAFLSDFVCSGSHNRPAIRRPRPKSGQAHPCIPDDIGDRLDEACPELQRAYGPGARRFRAAPCAIGQYNGKILTIRYGLRGGSAATPAPHFRPTYRNFFPSLAHWRLSGIRLARDSANRPD